MLLCIENKPCICELCVFFRCKIFQIKFLCDYWSRKLRFYFSIKNVSKSLHRGNHYSWTNSYFFVSFSSMPISSSGWPAVSLITTSTNRNPMMHPMPKVIMHPCKSTISNKMGNNFDVTNAAKLIATLIIAVPIVRIYKI